MIVSINKSTVKIKLKCKIKQAILCMNASSFLKIKFYFRKRLDNQSLLTFLLH